MVLKKGEQVGKHVRVKADTDKNVEESVLQSLHPCESPELKQTADISMFLFPQLVSHIT